MRVLLIVVVEDFEAVTLLEVHEIRLPVSKPSQANARLSEAGVAIRSPTPTTTFTLNQQTAPRRIHTIAGLGESCHHAGLQYGTLCPS
jgi:hypothetical protein